MHLTTAQLEAGLEEIRRSPRDEGVLEMIVRRPEVNGREVLEEGRLDLSEGLVGDGWRGRSGERDRQLTLMNSRAAALLAQDRARWPLAGDQLYVDLDLSTGNLPAGSQLAVGTAVIEVTALPHTGCRKFSERFGAAAKEFVNSPAGRQLNLRGINARVVQAGVVRVGDAIRKTPPSP